MSIKDKEYSFSVNNFKKPATVSGQNAVGVRLMELMTMEPGDDPLHPDMGVGIRTFRYGLNNLDELEQRISDQIDTYLPFYQNVEVGIIITPDKVCNIEIKIGDTVFVYDSATAVKPIKLDDIMEE